MALEIERQEIEKLNKEKIDSLISNNSLIDFISNDIPQSLFSEEIKKNILQNKFISTWSDLFNIESNILSSSQKLNFLELYLNNCISLFNYFSDGNILEISIEILKEKKLNDLPIEFLDIEDNFNEYFIQLGIYDLENFLNFITHEGNTNIEIDFLELKKRFILLFKYGLSNFLFGNSLIPSDPENFIQFLIKESSNNVDFKLIKLKTHMSLEEIGQEYGLTRERIRQKLNNYFKKLSIYSKYFLKFNEIILKKVKKYGGILDLEEAWISNYKCTYETIAILCYKDFNSNLTIINKKFLVIDENILNNLKLQFKKNFKTIDSINIDEIIENTAIFNWKSTRNTLKLFIKNIMDLEIDENENIDTSKFASGEDIIELTLKKSSKALHFSEVAEIIKNSSWGKFYENSLQFERTIHAALDRADKFAILFAPGTFIHKDNLEINYVFLKEFIEICKDELKNFELPTSTTFLYELLKNKYNINLPWINPYTLNSFLKNQPGIINFRKNRVGLSGSVKNDKSISEILEDIILEKSEPLTYKEIIDFIPINFSVPLTSIPNAISSNPNIITIKGSIIKLTHVILISEYLSLREKIEDLAIIYLKTISEKIYINPLISYIKQNLSLSNEKNCDIAIRVFLQESSKLFISSNGIVFLREFLINKEKINLEDIISLIIDTELVIRPFEIKEILLNEYKFYDLVEPTFYAVLERGISKNLFDKKPYTFYFSLSIDDLTLYQKIELKYGSIIENTINKVIEKEIVATMEQLFFMSEYLFYNEKYKQCLIITNNFILENEIKDNTKYREFIDIRDICLSNI